MQYSILCFGDSNTWGVDYENDCRLSRAERWTGILQSLFGNEALVIEEGLSGRTTVRDDPYEPHRSGIEYLPACLMSHEPLDVVIVMLGTNDLKRRFGTNAEDVARGISKICDTIDQCCLTRPVRVLIVSPAPFGNVVDPPEMWAAGIAESRRLGSLLAEIASERNALFFDAGVVCHLDHSDGIHLNRNDHSALAHALHGLLVKALKVSEKPATLVDT